MSTHLCPCGCGAQIAQNRLSCKRSWFKVPQAVRARVWDTYRAKDGSGHLNAVAEAIACIEEQRKGTP